MILLWRGLLTFFFSTLAFKSELFKETRISFRVLPTDVDILWHMNNGRYLSMMDLGRLNFMIRTNFFKVLSKYKIYPVIASEMIRFKKSLGFFQKYTLTTQLLGWDDKFFYIKHFFKVREEIYALAVVKVRFLHRKEARAISPQEIIDLTAFKLTSPALPGWIFTWNEADQHFYESVF